MEPVFPGIEQILEIHLDQIKRYGGAKEVRDMGLLQSAIAMPAAGFRDEYHHKDVFDMAAAYLFHIVSNHPFVDGNNKGGRGCGLRISCIK